MSDPTITYRAESQDVEELSEIVAPWVFYMQQMSRGHFSAQIDFTPLDGILVSHEHWSKCIMGMGTSPPGYFALAAIAGSAPFIWSGTEANSTTLACGFDGPEVEFLTPDGEEHWVVLVPLEKLSAFLGEESFAALPRDRRNLRCNLRQRRQLGLLVDDALERFRAGENSPADPHGIHVLEDELLNTVSEILASSDSGTGCSTPRKRYSACRRAIRRTLGGSIPANVSEMAAAAGVSVRVLQLGFQETLGISPHRFLQRSRLNQLHRELRHASKIDKSVTDLMLQLGLHELGRAAVGYKRLFDESPSATLARHFTAPALRLKDALPG